MRRLNMLEQEESSSSLNTRIVHRYCCDRYDPDGSEVIIGGLPFVSFRSKDQYTYRVYADIMVSNELISTFNILTTSYLH